MSIATLKVGDKIKPSNTSYWSSIYSSAEVLAIVSETHDGRGRVWVRAKERISGALAFATLDLPNVKGSWERIVDFYKTGKKYKTLDGTTTYTILEVREVGNPALESDRLVAFAMADCGDGRYGVALTLANFKHHKEIK